MTNLVKDEYNKIEGYDESVVILKLSRENTKC